MKVFLSWSGETSHAIAKVLRDWLPQVIQSIDPYVSSEDIDKGARWSSDIAGELDASSYGIICLTADNIGAPWINFEAGALGKSVDKARVSPFLFRVQKHEVQGPLVQFQFTVAEKDDVLKLVHSLNEAAGSEGIPSQRLATSFNVWWPHLEQQLAAVPIEKHKRPAKREATDQLEQLQAMTAELLDLARNNSRTLYDQSNVRMRNDTDLISNFSSSSKKFRWRNAPMVGVPHVVLKETATLANAAFDTIENHLLVGGISDEELQTLHAVVARIRELVSRMLPREEISS